MLRRGLQSAESPPAETRTNPPPAQSQSTLSNARRTIPHRKPHLEPSTALPIRSSASAGPPDGHSRTCWRYRYQLRGVLRLCPALKLLRTPAQAIRLSDPASGVLRIPLNAARKAFRASPGPG